MTIFPSLSEV